MTSKSIIKMVAEEMGRTQKEVKEFADAFEIVLKKFISESAVKEKIKCMDLTFSKQDTKERKGRNPQTGESITIPASKKLSVKPSKDMKDIIKG